MGAVSVVGSADNLQKPLQQSDLVPLRLPHVRALDGVRGIAAILVVVHHCMFGGLSTFVGSYPSRLVEATSGYFMLGVDVFFVLSGYLITSLLLLDRRRPRYYQNFYWKRAFRILPPLILVLLSSHYMGYTPWFGVITGLLFVANLPTLFGLPEYGPYWSLAIEEQFYLAWPSVVRKMKAPVMYRFLIACIVLPIVLRALSIYLHHGRTEYTFVHCDGLALGAMLALLAFRARIPWRNRNNLNFWRTSGRWLFWCGLVLMAFSVTLRHAQVQDYGTIFTSAGVLSTGVLAYLITHQQSATARFLGSKPLRFLGNISYMVYLSHLYILNLYNGHTKFWANGPTEGGLYLRLLVVLAVTILWSTISLYAFERPVGRLRRFFVRL